jgi:hypothetical protein
MAARTSETCSIQGSVSRLGGSRWLLSDEKTRFDRNYLRVLTIVSWAVEMSGRLAVKVIDRQPNTLYRQTLFHPLFGDIDIYKITTLHPDARAREQLREQNGVSTREDKYRNGVHQDAGLVGGVLRKYRIDEVPQVRNTLHNLHQLLLMGPSVWSKDDWVNYFKKDVEPFKTLHGYLTHGVRYGRVHLGVLQNGFVTHEDQAMLDIAYIESATRAGDRRLFNDAIRTVVRGTGA